MGTTNVSQSSRAGHAHADVRHAAPALPYPQRRVRRHGRGPDPASERRLAATGQAGAVRRGGCAASQPAPWEPEPSFASQCFPASHGIPARIVLYRMPIQSKSRSRMDLELAIRDEVVLRLAELYGRRPDEIDRIGACKALSGRNLIEHPS